MVVARLGGGRRRNGGRYVGGEKESGRGGLRGGVEKGVACGEDGTQRGNRREVGGGEERGWGGGR